MARYLFAAQLLVTCVSVSSPPPPPDSALDCSLRSLLADVSSVRVPWLDPSRVYDALQLGGCPGTGVRMAAAARHPQSLRSLSANVYADADKGDDLADGSSPERAVRSLETARALARSLSAGGAVSVTVSLRGTFFARGGPLVLGAGDNNVTWRGPAIISGGIPLSDLEWSPAAGFSAHVLEAALPPGVPTSGVFSLFDGISGRRLTAAREPNGDSETMMQPAGWALARGNINGSLVPPGDFAHIEVAAPGRNNSVFSVFGRDFDPRNVPDGYVWYGEAGGSGGGVPSLFEGGRTFWANKSIPGGLRWNASGGIDPHSGLPASPFNASSWAPVATGRRAHVFHDALWGGWVYDVAAVDAESQTMTFARGGWQEGRGGGVGTQPFFVEGERAALDAPGEFWVDADRGMLVLWPNDTAAGPPPLLVLPVLETVLVVGAGADGVALEDLTFAHTTDGLMEMYAVPAAGDWSLRRSAAVAVDGASDASLSRCTWARVGGNALLVTGAAQRTSVADADFYKPGGSAIAVVGYIPRADGDAANASYPNGVAIVRTVAEGVGVLGKQTSALFVSLACGVSVVDSVLFSGPRAGVNLNDDFCGGHAIERNVIFDWVRETQDHGPINTWGRQMYVLGNTTTPLWTRVVGNAIFNGPSANRDLGNLFPSIDNDDGSALMWNARNVLIYGGAKNYLGQDKVWDSNLIVFPGRWSGDPCLCAWGGRNHVYSNNTCVAADTDFPLSLDSSVEGNTCAVNYSDAVAAPFLPLLTANTYHTASGAYNNGCQAPYYNLSSLQALGQELGSVVVKGYTVDGVLAAARTLLGI